ADGRRAGSSAGRADVPRVRVLSMRSRPPVGVRSVAGCEPPTGWRRGTPPHSHRSRKETTGMPHATSYDAIVIGTSQGGRFLPIALAQAGRKVALVERGHVGGACVNVACTPTKTMVASARVAYLARRGPDYGVRTGPVSVDLSAVLRRKQAIVEGDRAEFEGRLT